MPGKVRPEMAQMDSQMRAMQEMHDKMMAAKTPEERSALMAEQMKTMQNGMTMMNGMSSGAMGGMKGDTANSPKKALRLDHHIDDPPGHHDQLFRGSPVQNPDHIGICQNKRLDVR